MADTVNKLPKSLTLKLEYTITLEDVADYEEISSDEVTLQLMLDKLRECAEDAFDYNAIQTATVFDEVGDEVA